MTPRYSRSIIGKRAIGKVPCNHGKNLTIVGAIALDGVRCTMAYEGGTTREIFLEFIREALLPSLRTGDVVVMDNLRSHHTEGVRESIESVGATVLYLPSYSPELNPIEKTWSKLKQLLRRAGARTLKRLSSALAHAIKKITCSDIAGWFTGSGYRAQHECGVLYSAPHSN